MKCALYMCFHSTISIQIKCKKQTDRLWANTYIGLSVFLIDLVDHNWSCSQQQQNCNWHNDRVISGVKMRDDEVNEVWMLQWWQRDPAWCTPVLMDVLGHPEKWCMFGTPYLILPICCNQMDLNLGNVKATAVFLHLAHFDVVVQ